ncbi:MAG: hypothetical protein A3C02_00750 [Candidatus Andersenbacteria bacterium RIFCSPHIGHO2_02_FULL_45_11]|uniref:Big-1 domain-containing protein n=1 Tax=Candidatus Andersenbacteria bacterium RIFCSPHIGHO2_12_FULL_45_11 TaxID=1797281 RepID=A0A1G1X5S2_9BACT|nr:MAG: hypothetical protein A2805_01680 [Candidatus Andersenbacteria bacterium RIFCSPHIGHO2_01_FULL_46_36]OGY33313.1 MAG: hypothetical protein A3C02_00750 [Candidatus Andersenbacteria bacterium RIFCSPHIGHO2_02_FULL_45_11]OGY34667.1 MAG: hypothetical protein A3D99_04995 [Candidatus Andersenbacteria bacterium RIFCSPHIGHO2_12_FULL_45_11]
MDKLKKKMRVWSALTILSFVLQPVLPGIAYNVASADEGESAPVVVEVPQEAPAPEESQAPTEIVVEEEPLASQESAPEPTSDVTPAPEVSESPVAETTEAVVAPDPAVAEEEKTQGQDTEEGAWNITSNGAAITKESVSVHATYTAPQNSAVKVKFTKLPDTPGTLTIKEVKLTEDEQKQLGAVSDTAYDITSTMENGSFRYNLTLPKPSNAKDVTVKYAETRGELDNAQDVTQKATQEESTVTITGLDHFTIFAVSADTAATAPGTGVYTTVPTISLVETVPGQIGVGTLSLNVPSGFEFDTSSAVSVVRETHTLSCAAANKVQLDGIEPVWASQSPTATSVSFNVTQASSATCDATLHFSGAKVRPINGTPLAMGDFTVSSSGTVTATLDTVSATSGLQETVGAFSASASTIAAVPATVEADGTTASVVTVTITDQFGNPLSGKTVTLAKTSGAGSPVIGAASGPSDSNGQVTFSVTSTTPAVDVFTATNTTDAAVVTDTATITFVDTIAPAVPSLVGPVSGTITQPASVLLDWSIETDPNNISNPVSYYYQSALNSVVGANNALTSSPYASGALSASEIDASGSPDNTYYWQARACDSLDNCSDWSGPWMVTIDGVVPVNPTVTSTSHTVSTWSTDTTVDLSISGATDALSGVDGFSYEWDTNAITTPDATKDDEETTTNVTSSSLVAGDSHYFHLRTVDNAGNWSAAMHVGPFFIDADAPAVPALTGPADGALVAATGLLLNWEDVSDGLNNPVTYYYQSATSDAVGANNAFSSPIYTSGAMSTSEIDASGTSNGTYYWQVRACDSLGNCSDWSGPWEVTIDRTAPATTASAIDGAWTNQDVTITLTCNDVGAAGCNTTYYTTNGDTPTIGSNIGSTISLTTDGIYTIKYFSVDAVGNTEAVVTEATQVRIDKSSPTIPGLPSTLSPTKLVLQTWAWADSVDNAVNSAASDISHYVIRAVQGATTIADQTADATASYISSLTDGIWNFFVKAVDNAGNESAESVTGTVNVDTVNPVATINSIASPTNDTTPSFTGTATDDNSGIQKVEYTTDGGSNWNLASYNSGDDTYSFTTTTLAEGSYTVSVKATDNAGNESTPVVSTQVVIDTTAPLITLAGSTPVTVEFGTTYTDAGATASDDVDGNITANIVTVNPVNTNAVGAYTVTHNVNDAAGNSATQVTRTVNVVDTIAPTTPVANIPSGDYLVDQSVTISSTDANAFTIYYTLDGSTPTSASTLYTGPVTIDHSLTLKAIAIDGASNASGIMTEVYAIAPVVSEQSIIAITTSNPSQERRIDWTTDDPSTSRVVFGTTSVPVLGSGPNYGYTNSSDLLDVAPNKVTNHSVLISGLNSNTTYFYRVISAGSPESVSNEYSFGTEPTTGGAGTGGSSGDSSSSTTVSSSSAGRVLGAKTTAKKSPASTIAAPVVTGTQIAYETGSGRVYGTTTSGQQVSQTLSVSPSPTPTTSPEVAGEQETISPTPEPQEADSPSALRKNWMYWLLALVIAGLGYAIYRSTTRRV